MTATARGRLSTITIDQAISAGSNVLIAVVAARTLDVESFGYFGIVFLVFVSAQGVVRSVVGEPLLIRPDDATGRAGEAVGTALMLGLGIAVVVGLSALGAGQLDTRLGWAMAVLAVCTPLLVLQDLGRYLGFASLRPVQALVLDVLWLFFLVVAVGYVVVADVRDLPGFIAAWAGSGALAGVAVFWQHRGNAVRLRRAWLRETWQYSWRYLASFSITQGGALVATVALTLIAGAEALAGVRGALLLLGVASTVQIAAGNSGVTDIARMEQGPIVRARAWRISAFAVAIALVNGAVLLALPDRWGRAALGDSWSVTEPLLWPAIAQIALSGALLGARAGLLGTRAVRTTMRVDLAFTPALVLVAIVGAVVGGAIGYFWFIVVALTSVTVLWWTLLARHLGLDENGSRNVKTTQGEAS